MKLTRVLAIVVLFVSVLSFLGCGGSEEKNVVYHEDIAFFHERFPKIDGIQSVKYIYFEKASSGVPSEIPPAFFEGVAVVSDEYVSLICDKYEWENTEVKIPEKLVEGEHTLLYSMKYDTKIKGEYLGYVYLCKELNMIYFKGEY